MVVSNPRAFLERLFFVAVNASIPAKVLPHHMPAPPKGKTIVIGAGKASSQMAAAFEQLCGADENWHSPVSGLVVTQYGSAEPCEKIEIVESAHPVPDNASRDAAQRMLELAQTAGADDLVVALISGGGSSLLCLPFDGLTLADKQTLNSALLASGAPISSMNAIRKMFSGVKGGRLGVAAYPARLVSLVLSDVPGDDPAMVASGPTVASTGGAKEAADLVDRHGIELSKALQTVLDEGRNPPPMPDDYRFVNAQHEVIASARLSLDAAARVARDNGCEVMILSDAIEGEACEVGKEHGRLIRKNTENRTNDKPLLILSGGETTVTLAKGMHSAGKGGRNSEYLLALAIEIEGIDNVLCLAADTDGRDGSEDNAGAYCDGQSFARMKEHGIDAHVHLTNHDAWTAFERNDDLLITGPTGTNVNDFRALLIW